jgi:hypothetical protein
MIGLLVDLRKEITSLIVDEDYITKLPAFFDKINARLTLLQNFYKGKTYSLGYITLADFLLVELSYYI